MEVSLVSCDIYEGLVSIFGLISGFLSLKTCCLKSRHPRVRLEALLLRGKNGDEKADDEAWPDTDGARRCSDDGGMTESTDEDALRDRSEGSGPKESTEDEAVNECPDDDGAIE